jgi:hypothetical protein
MANPAPNTPIINSLLIVLPFLPPFEALLLERRDLERVTSRHGGLNRPSIAALAA